jgi:6-phosphofructokinase
MVCDKISCDYCNSVKERKAMAVKRIAVLTGGGDCPGLNPYIKGVVTRAADFGIEVLGLQNGWKSLVSTSRFTSRSA